jgi:hypothetical protein
MRQQRIGDDDTVEQGLAECRLATREMLSSSFADRVAFDECIRNTRERIRLSWARIESVKQLLTTVDQATRHVQWPPEPQKSDIQGIGQE